MITVTASRIPTNYYQLEGVPLSLALLDPDYKQLHKPVMCKDYIHDAFWSEITNNHSDVYGFKWAPGKLDPNADIFRLSLETKSDKYNKTNFKAAQKLLNLWEERMGFPLSKIKATTNEKTYVLEFSKEWTKQPIRISLLTTLIRVGIVYDDSNPIEFMDKIADSTITPITPADTDNVASSRHRIKAIWGSKKWPTQDYHQFKGSMAVHNGAGIVAYREK